MPSARARAVQPDDEEEADPDRAVSSFVRVTIERTLEPKAPPDSDGALFVRPAALALPSSPVP